MSGINKTFGNSPAAITLAKILINDRKQIARVGKHLSKFSLILNELTKTDTIIRIGVSRLIFKEYIGYTKFFSEEVETYLANVIRTRYKIWLKEQKSTIPYKIRKTWV